MAHRLGNARIISERVTLRIVPVGQATRWLVVTTDADADDPAMQSVISEAQALLKSSEDLDGVEVVCAQGVR